MKSISNTLFALVAITLITSCNSKRKPNYQYFPNMYESVAYEAYSSHEVFSENYTSEALTPPEGTVKRGWLPYEYKNTPAGYAHAKANLNNPLPFTEANANNGKELYTIYCAICHGDKGDGKGTLVKREKILGVPAYNDPGRNITQGSIYHVMYYGINSMGSYAAQTSTEERWQIAQYVESLKDKLDGKTPRLDKTTPNTISNKDALFGSPNFSKVSLVDSLGVAVDSLHVVEGESHDEMIHGEHAKEEEKAGSGKFVRGKLDGLRKNHADKVNKNN